MIGRKGESDLRLCGFLVRFSRLNRGFSEIYSFSLRKR